MNFITYEFLVFFAIVSAFYFLVQHRAQNRMLLVASYVFYGWWDWRFLGLLLLSSLVDFTCGLLMDPERKLPLSAPKRKRVISVSIVTNLGILSFFK